MNKENNWRERFDKKFPEMEKFRVDENDKYNGEIENFIEQAIKAEKKKWEINREVGVSEVLAFEAGQKDARAGLLEKIEERIEAEEEKNDEHSQETIDILEDFKEEIILKFRIEDWF